MLRSDLQCFVLDMTSRHSVEECHQRCEENNNAKGNISGFLTSSLLVCGYAVDGLIMESSPLNAVRKDAAQRAGDFLVAVLGYLYVESKRRFSNLEVSTVEIYFAMVRGLAKSPPTMCLHARTFLAALENRLGWPGEPN